jgi:hypothetical protein
MDHNGELFGWLWAAEVSLLQVLDAGHTDGHPRQARRCQRHAPKRNTTLVDTTPSECLLSSNVREGLPNASFSDLVMAAITRDAAMLSANVL